VIWFLLSSRSYTLSDAPNAITASLRSGGCAAGGGEGAAEGAAEVGGRGVAGAPSGAGAGAGGAAPPVVGCGEGLGGGERMGIMVDRSKRSCAMDWRSVS